MIYFNGQRKGCPSLRFGCDRLGFISASAFVEMRLTARNEDTKGQDEERKRNNNFSTRNKGFLLEM